MLIRSMRKIKIVWVYLSPKCAAVTHLVKSYKRKEINIPKFKNNFFFQNTLVIIIRWSFTCTCTWYIISTQKLTKRTPNFQDEGKYNDILHSPDVFFKQNFNRSLKLCMNFLLAIIQTTQRGNTRRKRGINVGIKIKVGMGGVREAPKILPPFGISLLCLHYKERGGGANVPCRFPPFPMPVKEITSCIDIYKNN